MSKIKPDFPVPASPTLCSAAAFPDSAFLSPAYAGVQIFRDSGEFIWVWLRVLIAQSFREVGFFSRDHKHVDESEI